MEGKIRINQSSSPPSIMTPIDCRDDNDSEKKTQQLVTEPLSSIGNKRQYTTIEQHTLSRYNTSDIEAANNLLNFANNGSNKRPCVVNNDIAFNNIETQEEADIRRQCDGFGVAYVPPSNTIMRRVMNKELSKKKDEEYIRDDCSRLGIAHHDDINVLKRKRSDKMNANRKKRCIDGNKEKQCNNTTSVDSSNSSNNDIKRPTININSSVRNAIKSITKTKRCNGKHQAPVCVICDRLIIGVEKIHPIDMDKILMHKHRLSIESYEKFYQLTMNPILAEQYRVEGLEGILLSPRSRRTGDSFECCSECFSSLKPSKRSLKTPPKHSIANGFAFGTLPSKIVLDGSEVDIPDYIPDIMSAAIARQRPYGFIFAFLGGAHKSVSGHFQFFDMDQSFIGGVLNNYQNSQANDHILVALVGRFAPGQREIAKRASKLDSRLYIALITWLIDDAKHPGYKDVTPPRECPSPRLIHDEPNVNNTDESGDPNIELDEDVHGTHTFTSAHDPNERSGVYKDSTDFFLALMNQQDPLLIGYGGEYVNSRMLMLEWIFPIVFPFGIGGPRMNRPTKISEIECLKHYLRTSLPQFMRGDFILVVMYMYNRIRSYISGIVTCKSNPVAGLPFADAISQLSTNDITKAAERASKRSHNDDRDTSLAGKFIDKISTSCKVIGYSAAAASEARRKMFGYCDRLGMPSMFVTVSPDDECSFRVRLWASAGTEIDMLNLDASDADCILDYKVRKNTRINYPGACAIEYQSIVQVLLRDLFGWDSDKQEGTEGIFGTLLAWTVAHEEQGRKTLHGHWLLWVKNFQRMRRLLFSANSEEQKKARDEFIKYADEVMSDSFDVELPVKNNICCEELSEKLISDNITSPTADDVCNDDPQTIRNSWNKHRKNDIKGKVMKCKMCNNTISTVDIVNSALSYHIERSRQVEEQQHSQLLPIHQRRIDLASYRYPYDCLEMKSPYTNDHPEFWMNGDVRTILLNEQNNVHDWNHRPTCFKKNSECRFKLGKQHNGNTYIHIEDSTDKVDDDSQIKTTSWRYLSGDIEETYPYCLVNKRPMGCQFINTHNVHISRVFACNTNVQIGEPCHMYYNTNYTTKNTQEEDSDRFIRIGTQVCKSLVRRRTAAIERAVNSNTDIPSDNDPDFAEGLSRMLSGIGASLSRAVCSSTMANLIVSNDGARFEYSHDTTNLLVSQAEDVLDGKEGEFRIRTNVSKHTKEKVMWPDSPLDCYLNRPKELEDMCYYAFTERYEKVNKTFKQMNRRQQDDDGNMIMMEEENNAVMRFTENHPGHEFCHLQQRKHKVIPVVSMRKGNLCRLEELEIGCTTPSATVIAKREMYAKMAMIMFLPFRSIDDIQIGNGCTISKHWDTFTNSMSNGRLWGEGLAILHNIEHRATAEEMKGAKDPIFNITKYEKVEGKDDNDRSSRDNKDDPFSLEFSEFDNEAERDVRDGFNSEQTSMRSNGHLIDNADISRAQMINARIITGVSNLLESSETVHEDLAQLHTDVQSSIQQSTMSQSSGSQHSFHNYLMFVNGALLGGNYDSYADNPMDTSTHDTNEDDVFRGLDLNTQRVIPTLISVARKVALEEKKVLDEKQYMAYEIIACSFLLKVIDDGQNDQSSPFYKMDTDQLKPLTQQLEAKGGFTQLLMFLTGFAGAGKSTCVKIAQRFCFEFCNAVSIPWNVDTFLFTATTGSAASLFEGQTIHDAAYLNGQTKNISHDKYKQWENVRILIIDEVSFATIKDIEKLDIRLKILKGRQDVPFGGVSIVFSGDFHQLKPVMCESHGALYDGLKNGIFEANINVAIFLEKSHRFDNDLEYGELLKRLWHGNITVEDIETLNTRLIGKNGVTLPEINSDDDLCYASPTNKERNCIQAGTFDNLLNSGMFPSVNSNDPPPAHTLLVEAGISSRKTGKGSSNKTKVNSYLTNRIMSTCGDSHCKSGQGKLIPPTLPLYPGAYAMCTDNSKLKTNNVGNGTTCRVSKVKLKDDTRVGFTNYDGKKVKTTNALNVEYVEFTRFPETSEILSLKKSISALESDTDNDEAKADELAKQQAKLKKLIAKRTFKLSPMNYTAKVSVSLDDNVKDRQYLKGVGMHQLPINMNDATTGHKLQGMSKDKVIVSSWSFASNWIYVVLSRVRTLNGLFLLKPLPTDCLERFKVPRELQSFEHRMRRIEAGIISIRKRNMEK